ncbi:non-ribosomal peptide synthetase [Streptomyces sp. NPDC057298]|uniref:non-ribosomal peptide synthetase n=1 Tax=Streptomyces sp. NPDC057298 TaxID=3346091 RepID=UPI00362FF1D8
MQPNTASALAHLSGIREDDDRTAIIAADGVYSYGDLRHRVTRYADVLASVGLRPGDAVVISVEYGPDAVAAMFATLEAGAAFVWLNSDQPAARNRIVVRDCGARYLLADSSQGGKQLVADLAELHLGLLRTGESSEIFIERISRDRGPAALPTDTTTVVYTSGSTGAPKGIVLTRANVDQLTEWYVDEVGLAPGAKQLQLAQFTYDAACVEIFSAIRSGATLVMPPPEVKSNVREVVEWARLHGVTHMASAPSIYRVLVDALNSGGGAALDQVRALTVSGEELRPALVSKMRAAFPQAAIYNMYGQTENILATCHLVTPEDEQAPAVPVGRALPGREILLRDDAGDEVDEGELGEVWVRSRFLAPGYLNNAELTDAAFFPDPQGEPGVRIYRTGDLARRTADGQLVFHRRMDHQVKIRGVRVELGEIEATMLNVPGIVHAGVVAREVGEGRSQLVAYVQAGVGAEVSPERLRGALAQQLPKNMVPSRIVVLDRMPLTASGKIDRKRLPDVTSGSADPGRSDAPVGGATAKRLARIWSQVLAVQPQAEDADFFALGGDSLSVPRVRDAIKADFGVDIPLGSFYECPQLDQMADRIDSLVLQEPVRRLDN